MNTQYEGKKNFSLKLMVTVAGVAGALMAPTFAASPAPFGGAFVDGALGMSSGAVKVETETGFPNDPQWPVQSSTLDKGKSAFVGRLGVGYGYDLPFSDAAHRFNLTGMLTYSLPQKVDEAGSKLKNSVGLLFQPGYYLPLNSNPVLIYGTLGYAFASIDPRGNITVDGNQLGQGAQGLTYKGPSWGDGSKTTSGLVLGLGAKYAITGLLYAGFDYSHTDYDYKKNGQALNWANDGQGGPGFTANTEWRTKGVKTDTFLLTVGYRFF